MTSFKQKIVVFLLGIAAILGGGVAAQQYGSVSKNSEYFATSTKSFTGGTGVANLTVLSNYDTCSSICPGTLGQVTITGANTGIIRLWDATTSNVNLRTGATSTLTFVEIPASTAAGTYVFDTSFKNGILYELAGGTAPTSTISYRVQ